jgi:signal transduction histidine kinase
VRKKLLREPENLDAETCDDPALAQQLKDYASVGMQMARQRQITFAAALFLAGYYYNVKIALICLLLIICSESFDFFTFRNILAWSGKGKRAARGHLTKLMVGTALSSTVVVYYAIAIAIAEGPSPHFISLFFLLAAGLFAAMHNHQVKAVMMSRLILYGGAFVFIPVWDIVITGAQIQSQLWAQLFTSICVLFFVVDCSLSYLSIYRVNQKQMAALEVETQNAKQAVEAKAEFLSTISHELRTPLTSIKGSIDLMSAGRLGPMSDSVVKVLRIAQRNCDRLIRLVDDTLDLHKIIAGKMSFSMGNINLPKLVEATVLTNRPFAERLGITLELEQCDGELFVIGDWVRLEQVLTNILSNAAKFSETGSNVQIRIDSNNDFVRVLVVDRGVGLTEKDRADVFDRYSKVNSPGTHQVGSTGIGMNISEKIMQAHGGKIDYFKNDGAGTTFFVQMAKCSNQPCSAEDLALIQKNSGVAA